MQDIARRVSELDALFSIRRQTALAKLIKLEHCDLLQLYEDWQKASKESADEWSAWTGQMLLCSLYIVGGRAILWALYDV